MLAEFVAISGVKQGEVVEENLDKEPFNIKQLPNIILDYLSGSMTQLIPLLMAGGLFRTIAAVLGPTMLGVLSADDPTYTFLYTTLYEATFTFIPIYWAMLRLRSSAPLRFWACSSAALSWPRPS